MELPQPRIYERPEAFDLVDVNAVIRNEFFGVNNRLLVVVDEWRVPASSVVPDLIKFSREDLNFVKSRLDTVRQKYVNKRWPSGAKYRG